MKKTAMLRKLLNEPGLLVVPGVYDCMTARIVERIGFKAVFMSGGGIRDAQLGMPDIGVATATEVVDRARYIANSVSLPLIVDADDGYGGPLAAYRTTQDLVRAGAAGIFIDDQKHPTKCPFLGIQEVLPRDEYLGKMGAVLEARDREDKDFVIVARIDAAATLGDDEMLARAKACVELGVDVILPHAVPATSKFGERGKETLRQLFKKIGAPEVLIWGMGPFEFTAKDYEEIGAKLWVPAAPIAAITKALFDAYQGLYDTGTLKSYAPPGIPDRSYLDKLWGLDFWSVLEKKYVLK
jgi:2-methylisocitrate lyase-like PEP mutase family enzyme